MKRRRKNNRCKEKNTRAATNSVVCAYTCANCIMMKISTEKRIVYMFWQCECCAAHWWHLMYIFGKSIMMNFTFNPIEFVQDAVGFKKCFFFRNLNVNRSCKTEVGPQCFSESLLSTIFKQFKISWKKINANSFVFKYFHLKKCWIIHIEPKAYSALNSENIPCGRILMKKKNWMEFLPGSFSTFRAMCRCVIARKYIICN